MNGKLLIDTNILVELFIGNPKVVTYLNEYSIYISCVTAIEIFSYTLQNKEQLNIAKSLISNFTILENINPEIQIIASNYRRRKQIKKTPDAIIAATAKYHHLPLLTFDAGFENLKDIDVIFLKK